MLVLDKQETHVEPKAEQERPGAESVKINVLSETRRSRSFVPGHYSRPQTEKGRQVRMAEDK